MHFKSYKAQGVVLHTVKYGESSLIAYLLTNTYGRQTYMVQGVRGGKNRSGKAAFFQPMFLLDYVGLESPDMEMHRMKDIGNAVTLLSTPFDVRKSTISVFMAEVLYKLVRDVEPQSPLFDFVRSSVEALDSLEEGVSNFHLWFLVRLSMFLGFYPGNEYIEGSWFDIQEGLFTPFKSAHGVIFDKEASALLNDLMSCDIDGLKDLKLSRDRRSGFMNSIISYFGYHLDSIHQVKSLQILKEVF